MMKIFRIFTRHLNYRVLFKTDNWYILPLLCIVLFFVFFLQILLLVIIYSIYIFRSNQCCFDSSSIIISLTSTPERFHHELPFAIHSLLSQTQLPKQIRIYLSPKSRITQQKNLTLKHLKNDIQLLDSSNAIAKLFDRLVEIRLEEEDYGPATKFLPIIKEFHSMNTMKSSSQAIMICDDDQYYHPRTISTLNEYSTKYPNSIVGFRGWRIRKDLLWGVRGGFEIDYHIIRSYHLSKIYRVGIVTATDAYLIRPSFFDSHIYNDFSQAPNDIRHVDDIWLNGHAAIRNITRYVVPSCCSHIGVTRTHALEQYLVNHKMTRRSANSHALKWFDKTWEKDLWYKFKGENKPEHRNKRTVILREWMNIIEFLKFIINFGFVYD
ncbi:unnamed protein product [Adineta steineri]|uniref:Glycosyltransferase 2-like domain-containing protein n=1 Tax=Adineta steineri TaxID=433720 RepID=A0A814TF01_9BILA|nr:unnamed protein product [Adineta steineri]CAF3568743.1 unnamed protein product [Adineta steineri]